MSSPIAKGRRNVPNIGFTDTVPAGSALQAVLITEDQIIAAVQAMAAALDGASISGGPYLSLPAVVAMKPAVLK